MIISNSPKNVVRTWHNGDQVVCLGDMEIWDGADLALLREALTWLYHRAHSRKFGVDMSFVKYVPSGFFGMLFDWHEKGVEVRLYSPQPHVARMLWFEKFFHGREPGVFQLCPELHQPMVPPTPASLQRPQTPETVQMGC